MGDSIAGAEAPPLETALKASGVGIKNAASDGGATVVEGDRMAGQIAESTWKDLAKNIASFHPDVEVWRTVLRDGDQPALGRLERRRSRGGPRRRAGSAGHGSSPDPDVRLSADASHGRGNHPRPAKPGLPGHAAHGIRSFCDYIADDARKDGPAFYADVEQVGFATTARTPCMNTVQLFQMMAWKRVG
ncbi:hypothetical protein [Streptomyces decoyicus]|uniref:hypothetical protein n=1 Tax=Streptomyces decoyicus TaxID=249567 RepID=UPI0033AF3878